jgi:hypothetical protein
LRLYVLEAGRVQIRDLPPPGHRDHRPGDLALGHGLVEQVSHAPEGVGREAHALWEDPGDELGTGSSREQQPREGRQASQSPANRSKSHDDSLVRVTGARLGSLLMS